MIELYLQLSTVAELGLHSGKTTVTNPTTQPNHLTPTVANQRHRGGGMSGRHWGLLMRRFKQFYLGDNLFDWFISAAFPFQLDLARTM